jgi:hypothetical protein
VLIREYTDADLDALRRMHAQQGFGYPFPDLADPLFVSKLVVENGAGRAVMASLARLTCEMYLRCTARANAISSRAVCTMRTPGCLRLSPRNSAVASRPSAGFAMMLGRRIAGGWFFSSTGAARRCASQVA